MEKALAMVEALASTFSQISPPPEPDSIRLLPRGVQRYHIRCYSKQVRLCPWTTLNSYLTFRHGSFTHRGEKVSLFLSSHKEKKEEDITLQRENEP